MPAAKVGSGRYLTYPAPMRLQAFLLALIGICFALVFVNYDALPELIPVHWDAQNHATGFMPKHVGAFLLPGITLFVHCVLTLAPFTSPEKAILREGRSGFPLIHGAVVTFLCAGCWATLRAALGNDDWMRHTWVGLVGLAGCIVIGAIRAAQIKS